MAKYQFKGLDEYAQYLQKIGKNTREICGAGVYAMADIVADKVRQNITALPSVNDVENKKAYKQNEKSHLSIKQKKGLLDGFGISPMQNDNCRPAAKNRKSTDNERNAKSHKQRNELAN